MINSLHLWHIDCARLMYAWIKHTIHPHTHHSTLDAILHSPSLPFHPANPYGEKLILHYKRCQFIGWAYVNYCFKFPVFKCKQIPRTIYTTEHRISLSCQQHCPHVVAAMVSLAPSKLARCTALSFSRLSSLFRFSSRQCLSICSWIETILKQNVHLQFMRVDGCRCRCEQYNVHFISSDLIY